MTGFNGKPSLIAIALTGLFVTGAFAQTAPTATSVAPMVTPANFAAGAATAVGSATTNIIYLQQTGNTPTVNITQDGNGNRIGTDATGVAGGAILNGSNQIVNIQQSGASSAVGGVGNVINTLEVYGNSVNLNVLQAGDSNTLNATVGNSTTGSNGANLNWQFNGNSNTLTFTGTGGTTVTAIGDGSNLTSGISVTGNGNTITDTMTGTSATGQSQLITVSGDNNVFNVSQTSSMASYLNLSQTGTGTTFNISQSGTYSNVANINAVAAGGSFNITQRSR